MDVPQNYHAFILFDSLPKDSLVTPEQNLLHRDIWFVRGTHWANGGLKMAVFFYWASNSPSLLNVQREKRSDTVGSEIPWSPVDRWFIPLSLSTRVLYIQKAVLYIQKAVYTSKRRFIHPKGGLYIQKAVKYRRISEPSTVCRWFSKQLKLRRWLSWNSKRTQIIPEDLQKSWCRLR